MNNELTTAIASRVNTLHQTVLDSVKGATDAVNQAMQASVEIGGHIQELPKGLRIAWLRDNCPKLTHKHIASYLSIANTYKRRKHSAIDHRFFTLLGMTDDQAEGEDDQPKPMKIAHPQWLAWSGKLTGFFSEMTKKEPPEQWSESYRTAVAEQLKPIVELYKKITDASKLQ